MLDVEGIKKNIESVKKVINTACEKAGGDPDNITLVVVTKTFGVDVVKSAIEAGVTDIGARLPASADDAQRAIVERNAIGTFMKQLLSGRRGRRDQCSCFGV